LQDHYHAVALPQPLPACQCPSTELLMQVVQYIMDRLHCDLSVSALARRFSVEGGVLFSAFQSHTGTALDQFVLLRRIECALDFLKKSRASDGKIAVGIIWELIPAFYFAFSSYLGASPTEDRRSLPEKQQAASGERRKRPMQVCLLTSGRNPWSDASRTRGLAAKRVRLILHPVARLNLKGYRHLIKPCCHTTARKETV
jgi:AraC-like DNA-binding protein